MIQLQNVNKSFKGNIAIQDLIDKRIEIMVLDIWNNVKVDKIKYLKYNTTFSNND